VEDIERRTGSTSNLHVARILSDGPIARVAGPCGLVAATTRTGGSLASIDETMKTAMDTQGAVGVALVDFGSGMMLGSAGGSPELDLEVAAAGNTEVIRAKMNTMAALGLDDEIEDILITLDKQYHLIRLVNAEKGAGLFFYLVLSKSQANLALARRSLADLESGLEL
jgi:hypothetical protein